MDRGFTALAILAICVSGALSIPQEADPPQISTKGTSIQFIILTLTF